MTSGTTGILFLSIVLGVSYFRILARPKTVFRAIWKTLPVTLLALYAMGAGAHPVLVAALLLGALGDLCLAFEGERRFTAGLLAFLASHIAYIGLLWGLADMSLPLTEPWRIIAGLALALVTGGVLVRIWTAAGRMALPIVLYVVVFLVLASLTLGLANPLIFGGVALFILSDIILAIRKYWTGPGHRIDKAAAHVVWGTYYPAQLILATTLTP